MRRMSFRCADDVLRRSLMHHAPPLNQRRPRHAAFEARPPQRDGVSVGAFAAGLVAVLACSAATMALLVHFAPTLIRGVLWVVVTLAVAAGVL